MYVHGIEGKSAKGWCRRERSGTYDWKVWREFKTRSLQESCKWNGKYSFEKIANGKRTIPFQMFRLSKISSGHVTPKFVYICIPSRSFVVNVNNPHLGNMIRSMARSNKRTWYATEAQQKGRSGIKIGQRIPKGDYRDKLSKMDIETKAFQG